ncbi:COG1011 Predicted hydrolase (HAD superfamily) [Candidatus Nanopelagicaceae bacterium]
MFDTPELVIFDLDNTLYDYNVANLAGEHYLMEHLKDNLRISENEFYELWSAARVQVKETLGLSASAHSRLMYIREFLNSNKFPTYATFALECEQVFWRGYFDKMTLFNGVEAFISLLRLNQVKLILVTDLSTQIQLRKLAWLGLEKSFDLIVTSEESGGDKVTGKSELMVKKYVEPEIGKTWSIGDSQADHLFPSSSYFFRKVPSGKFKGLSQLEMEFSDFHDLIGLIQSSS